MKKLRCDKPYDLDEARKKKGLPRRKRKDSRTTAYELTIRIPPRVSGMPGRQEEVHPYGVRAQQEGRSQIANRGLRV